ncbi:phage holin family protein [Cohnella sp. GbtcB17]|uniref:phage holin family protein n=1 Tax=Cohnella sp. GbtcB17 TaxID=2824762 RepID=UPI001C2FA731|nr:phage holin family protein [Cohnella sp. GbtcB17]
MEWTVIENLLDPQLLIVLSACWVLGYILKRTPRVPDWSIVYIVTLAAVLLSIWILGPGPLPLLQGFLCGAVAVYGYQLVKQTKEGATDVTND